MCECAWPGFGLVQLRCSLLTPCLLAQHSTYARNVATHFAQLAGVGQLLSGGLHAQAELCPQQTFELFIKLGSVLVAKFAGFHIRSSSRLQAPTWRVTKVVEMGSLAAARRNASRASSSLTPSISYNTLPGWISATQYSGLPLPLPIRTSAGFSEIGLSGNTRIQIRPPRRM